MVQLDSLYVTSYYNYFFSGSPPKMKLIGQTLFKDIFCLRQTERQHRITRLAEFH